MIPLLVAVTINLPLVLDRVELFYRTVFLQDLRADFRDLDQHLASRDEMVRLLAKLPEPGLLVSEEKQDEKQLEVARQRYMDWVNRVLFNQHDILDIQFFDINKVNRFWLQRDPSTRHWTAGLDEPHGPDEARLEKMYAGKGRLVELTPIRLETNEDGVARAITMKLITLINSTIGNHPMGVVVMTIDIGGLVHNNPDTYWVKSNGEYLNVVGLPFNHASAFIDFPGLEEKFRRGQVMLWQGEAKRQIIWVPMLQVEDGRPLWVGRDVDLGPLNRLQETLIWRVLSIIFVLALVVALAAKWFAEKAEGFGHKLLNGIRQMLANDKEVVFSWSGGRELQQLGEDLTELAKSHAQNVNQLKQHTRELELSNKYKSEFLANMSHELRTPLNSIILLSKMLTEDTRKLGEEERKHASVINQASKDLRELIDAILDLSKMDAGKQILHVEQVNLEKLLQDVADLMEPQFLQAGLDFQLRIDPDANRQIYTDAGKLRQIIKNFLGNAVKFTREGQIDFRLDSAESPYSVRLSVEDTGVGIPKDKQKLIFEAFNQADGSTSRKFGGTGLGLTISRNLADALQGEIRLRSDVGKGSCFSLLLPETLKEDADIEIKPVSIEGDQKTAAQTEPVVATCNLSGYQLLLIEEDMQLLLKLSAWLEQCGACVSAAADADELKETLEEDFDFVLFASPVSGVGSIEDLSNVLKMLDKEQMPIVDLTELELDMQRIQEKLVSVI